MRTGVPWAESSRAAWIAPAWMLFQNSCVVPLGMTAIASSWSEPERLHAASSAAQKTMGVKGLTASLLP